MSSKCKVCLGRIHRTGVRAVRAVRACVRECGRAGVRARTARGGQVVCVGYDDLRRR